jgi:hypothetical protein
MAGLRSHGGSDLRSSAPTETRCHALTTPTHGASEGVSTNPSRCRVFQLARRGSRAWTSLSPRQAHLSYMPLLQLRLHFAARRRRRFWPANRTRHSYWTGQSFNAGVAIDIRNPNDTPALRRRRCTLSSRNIGHLDPRYVEDNSARSTVLLLRQPSSPAPRIRRAMPSTRSFSRSWPRPPWRPAPPAAGRCARRRRSRGSGYVPAPADAFECARHPAPRSRSDPKNCAT